MRMRQQAMQLGMTVKLSRMNDPEYAGRTIPCISYSIPYNNVKTGQRWRIERSLDDRWFGQGDAVRLSSEQLQGWGQKLDALAPGILALESTSIAVALYWMEQGEESTVESLKLFLEQVKTVGLTGSIS